MRIILIGKKGSGKDTFYDLVKNDDIKNVKFSKKLKELCSDITRMPDVMFTSNQLKGQKIPLKVEAPGAWKFYTEVGCRLDKLEYESPREMLQYVGTEVIRNHDKHWHIKQTLNTLKHDSQFVITDCRFLNELQVIEAFYPDVKVICIDRDSSGDNHASENIDQLKSYADIIISNDGSLQNYLDKVQSVVKELRNDTSTREICTSSTEKSQL